MENNEKVTVEGLIGALDECGITVNDWDEVKRVLTKLGVALWQEIIPVLETDE